MQSLNVHMGLDIKMIKKEDKKPSMGQITVCVLGKAQALVKQKKMKVDNLKIVVMDEADVFFQSEEDFAQTEQLIQKVDATVPDIQKLFFSATYSPQIINFIK